MADFLARAQATEPVLLTAPGSDKSKYMTLYADCAALTDLHLPCPPCEPRVDWLREVADSAAASCSASG